MTIKDLLDRKAKAITDAREIAENPDYTGEGELEESYQRAVSDARRFAQLEKDETERIAMDAEVAESRAKLESVIHADGQAAPAAVDPMLRSIQNFCSAPTEETPVKRFLTVPFAKRANEEWWMGGATPYASYTATSRLMTDLIFHENAESGVLAAGPSYIDTADGNTIYWPMLATDASATQTAERTAATLTYPVFSRPQLDSYRQDGRMTLTLEMVRDSAINIMQAVGDVASRALATQVASQLAAGTGTTMPDGLPTKAATGASAAAKTTFTSDELVDLYLSVLPGSRSRGSWIAGSAALAIIFKLKNDEGDYILHDISKGGVGTILGKPLFEDAAYPACTTGLKPITFGDVSQYRVRRVGGVNIERDDSVYFTQFESVVRFSTYMDADLFDTATNKCLLLA
jgi:HK97 family phage major capsid protein